MAQGKKTGGREAGTPNKATGTLRELVEAEVGCPLPVALARIGRKAQEQGDLQLAVQAYAKAATYVYPRLQAVTLQDNTPAPVEVRIIRQVITKADREAVNG